MPVHTPDEFRAALAKLGFSISAFARWMVEMGDGRDHENVRRALQRMMTGESRISGEMRVMLALLEKGGGVEMASARLRRRSTTARSFLQAKRKAVRLEQQQHPSSGTDLSAGQSPSG